MWNLNRMSTVSLYRQLIKLIETLIASGKLAPGERLPAERMLSMQLEINRSTVIRAYDELSDRGLLIRRKGSGTYVNSDKWGVQNFAVLNWQGPSVASLSKREEAFRRRALAEISTRKAKGDVFHDLSASHLAYDLLPNIRIAESAWRMAVETEQGESAAYFGLSSLRQAVLNFLLRQSGLKVPEEEILITSGARQAVFLITQCLLKPGDAVGIESSSYFYSLPAFQAAGVRIFALPVDSKGITIEGLEALAYRKTLKMIFLNPVFQNPTGSVMSEKRKKEVLAFCAAARIPVVEDDASSLLYFMNKKGITPIKAYDRQGQVIYIGSLSSYAGNRLRAGWLVAPSAVVRKLADARLMIDAGLSVLPQILALEYLNTIADMHLAAIRPELRKRAESLHERLSGIFNDKSGLSLPSGGLYSYAVFDAISEKNRLDMEERLLHAGFLATLGEAYGDMRCAFRFNHSLFNSPNLKYCQ